MTNIVCTYPSHAQLSGRPGWNNGVLGVTVGAAPAAFCQACQADSDTVNAATIRANAATAYTNNAIYIALAAPSTAQNTAQIKAMAQQINGLIRIITNKLDGTT